MLDTVGRGAAATAFGGGVAIFMGLVAALGPTGAFPALLQLQRKSSRDPKAALTATNGPKFTIARVNYLKMNGNLQHLPIGIESRLAGGERHLSRFVCCWGPRQNHRACC